MKKFLSVFLSLALLVTTLGLSVGTASAASLNPPQIITDIRNFDYVTANSVITVSFAAMGGKTLAYCETSLEGEVISTDAEFSFVVSDHIDSYGTYTIVMKAEDSDGATSALVRSFVYTENVSIDFYYDENENIVPTEEGATAKNVEIVPFEYTVGYGTTVDGNVVPGASNAFDAYSDFALQFFGVGIETASASGIPYQSFDIHLNGKTDGEVCIRHTGSTYTGERIAVKVWNPSTEEWDDLGKYNGSDSMSAAIDIATYAVDDTIHVIAILDYYTNGSNTIAWVADAYGYSDEVYEYLAGSGAGYVINSGSIFGENSADALEKLDEAGIPYGVVSGDNDDPAKFSEVYPASRYNQNTWFGASVNNNESHFDLVTIGNVDFVVVYFGNGAENDEATLAWAKDVMEHFSHRVGVVVTHSYLDVDNASVLSGYEALADLVDYCYNIKLVLCGSDEGAIVNERTTSDGRTVYEVLAGNLIGDESDGGYIRLFKVVGDTLSSVAYSAVSNKTNLYGDRESFSIDLDNDPNRFINSVAFSAYSVGDEVENPWDAEYGSAIVITGQNGTTYHHASYNYFPQIPEAGENIHVDSENLTLLIEKAEAIDTSVYTSDSVSNLLSAIESAKSASASDIGYAYSELEDAIGALEYVSEKINSSELDLQYSYNTDAFVEETGGDIYGEDVKAKEYDGDWFVIKPNGKIYLHLGVSALSTWGMGIIASQGDVTRTVYLNYAIDNAVNSVTALSYLGEYNGVYDVTEAFADIGFDTSATITIEKTAVCVRGDNNVAFDYIAFLVENPEGEADMSALSEVIESVEALDEGLYTEISWNKLLTAVESARELMSDATALQADVNYAVIEINNAIANLKLASEIGDVDGNGKVNLFDYMIVKSYYFSPDRGLTDEQLVRADANEDGSVNMFDCMIIKSWYFNGAK